MTTGFNLQKISYLRILALCFLVFFANRGMAQEFKIDAAFDSARILIGDQVKFRINIEHPKEGIVKVPIFTDHIQDKIEVLKVFLPDTLKTNNRLKISYQYLVTCFDSGEYKLEPISVPIEIGLIRDTLKVTPSMLTVVPMPVDTITQVRDIKPPLHTPLNFAEIWPYLLGVVLLLVIIFAVIYFIRKRKSAGHFPPLFKKEEPPYVSAIKELDKLRAEKLWQKNMVKQYYVRLSEIVRVYIEKRFSIEALEMTTDEIIASLHEALMNESSSVDLLKNLLTLADLVKFAKAHPLPDENEVSLLNAYQFINNTKPVISGQEQNNASETALEDDHDKVFN